MCVCVREMCTYHVTVLIFALLGRSIWIDRRKGRLEDTNVAFTIGEHQGNVVSTLTDTSPLHVLASCNWPRLSPSVALNFAFHLERQNAKLNLKYSTGYVLCRFRAYGSRVSCCDSRSNSRSLTEQGAAVWRTGLVSGRHPVRISVISGERRDKTSNKARQSPSGSLSTH
jgi:hypothetical protein